MKRDNFSEIADGPESTGTLPRLTCPCGRVLYCPVVRTTPTEGRVMRARDGERGGGEGDIVVISHAVVVSHRRRSEEGARAGGGGLSTSRCGHIAPSGGPGRKAAAVFYVGNAFRGRLFRILTCALLEAWRRCWVLER